MSLLKRNTFFVKLLKFTDLKTLLPFTVDIFDDDGKKLVTLKRGFTLFRSNVNVLDANQQKLGRFQQRLLSLGGKFEIFDKTDHPVAMLEGNWKGWDFKFKDQQGREIGTVTKKWAGLGKELFTTADNYVVDMSPQASDETLKKLVLSAAFCVDMVLKER